MKIVCKLCSNKCDEFDVLRNVHIWAICVHKVTKRTIIGVFFMANLNRISKLFQSKNHVSTINSLIVFLPTRTSVVAD